MRKGKVCAAVIVVVVAGCTTTNSQYSQRSASHVSKSAAADGVSAIDRQEQTLKEKIQGNGVEVARVGYALKVVLPGDISFDSGSAQINTEFRVALDVLAESINANPQTHIQVVGHTDSAGPLAINLKLSLDRAISVTTYLTAKGVSAGRLYPSGMGPDKPIADNKTDTGRAKNRRVELDIVPINGVAG